MKYLLMSGLCIVLLSSCCSNKIQNSLPQPPETVSLKEVLMLLDKDYKTAMLYLGYERNLEVCEATVTFDVSTTKTADGSLSVLVFSAGHTRTWNHESSVTYTLGRPSARGITKPELTDELQKAIVNAARQFESVKDDKVLDGLVAKTFSVEVDFVVTRTSSLGLALFNKVLGINGKYERDITNKINLTFATAGGCGK